MAQDYGKKTGTPVPNNDVWEWVNGCHLSHYDGKAERESGKVVSKEQSPDK